jgi:aspartate kinase
LRRLKVLKFGGTSLGTANGLRKAVEIIASTVESSRTVVVASALAGVTNRLVDLDLDWKRAGISKDGSAAAIARHFAWIRERHIELASAVLNESFATEYQLILDRQLRWLTSIVTGQTNSLSGTDGLLAIGERLSVPLLSLALVQYGLQSIPVDSAPIVRTNANFGNARVDLDSTNSLVQIWFRSIGTGITPVVTGFIGSTSDGRTTTLGRSGSDYSASAIAVALEAHVVERWTDTDGIYSANPREHRDAAHIPSLSLKDAIKKHRKTGLGIHPKALDLLEDASIPLHVRSTEKRLQRGSWVVPTSDDRPARPCRCDWQSRVGADFQSFQQSDKA